MTKKTTKPTPTQEAATQDAVKAEEAAIEKADEQAKTEETPTQQDQQPEAAPEPEASKPEAPKPQPVKPPTLASLRTEIEALNQTIQTHTEKIADLEAALARKRKPPVSNGKVQIIDKKTGQVFPSKNNTYQSLLKSGELKELVDKGTFGSDPAKNSFGWYALVRA